MSADLSAARLAKDRHIALCLSEPVESTRPNGFERFELLGDLPDFELGAMDLSVRLWGRRLSLPLFISSMTGGGAGSEMFNRRLAEAAQAAGIGMAVGSQSLMLKDPATAAGFQVRRWAPDILLFADLGLVHLNYGLDRASCIRAVEGIEADALMLYANHMHEAFQVGGDTDFTLLLERLGELAADFPYPIILKEVGNGFSKEALARLGGLPLAGVDVAGLGGTHWGRVEALMAGRPVGSPLEELGVPTAMAVEDAVHVLPPGMRVLASGGLRNGVEVAKALALGARAAGMALPFLKWASESADRVREGIATVEHELRLSMWWTGVREVAGLRGRIRRRP